MKRLLATSLILILATGAVASPPGIYVKPPGARTYELADPPAWIVTSSIWSTIVLNWYGTWLRIQALRA